MKLAAAVGGLAALLVGVPLALAQVTDRYQVSTAPEAQAYPKSLHVVVASPPEYVRDYIGRGGNDGHWKGPRYQATGNASLAGDSTMDWSAGIYRKPSTRQTIIETLVHDWVPVAEGTEAIERRVAGRDVGSVPGTWVLTQGSAMAGEARFELGLVFPICGRTAYLGIGTLTPATNSAGGAMGFGEYRINGMRPTEWNRAKVLETLQGVSLEGNLPAARVTAARRGARISGRVTDCNGAALAAQRVTLERRVGKKWRVVTRGSTKADGSYALTARGAGPFRVAAGSRRSNVTR